ncbi:MAG TPA: flagellar motor stator protein MotA [Candidatus Binatia bacterium]|jgi:chemotaxis protein MotA
MFTIIGIAVVLAGVIGGFAFENGPMHVLIQPAELMIIFGAAIGSLLVSAPGKALGQTFSAIASSFGSQSPTKADYLELLTLQYEIYQFLRKNGAVALDEHVQDVEKSGIFSKYPGFLKRHHAVDFFRDALKQVVNGTASAEELDVLLDSELDTHHEEAAIPIGLIQKTGDALPGLGIVAAVLGIIITMGSLDAGPEEIGHKIGAALVGTFLGVLMSYGMLGPIATNVEIQGNAVSRYMRCMKEGLIPAVRGASPIVAVEFARKAIFGSVRPSSDETDEAVKAAKSAS